MRLCTGPPTRSRARSIRVCSSRTASRQGDVWFNGWLERNQLISDALRPLEDRRADWFSEENLEKYFEVARDVLLYTGVAVINPDYGLNLL